MANVLFKQGTQDKLDEIRSAKSATVGTFYITNDSHRMYLGVTGGDAVPVNEGVTTVASLDDLPKSAAHLHVGQFYYVTAGNILCVFNGKTWAQINSNTDTVITDLDIAVANVDGQTDSVSITVTATNNEGETFADTYGIKGAKGTKVAADANGNVVITGDTYTLGADYNSTTHIASLKLNSENTDNDTQVNIKEGDNIKFAKNADGSLTLSAKDTQLGEVSGGWGNRDGSSDEGMYVKVKDTDGTEGYAELNPEIQVGAEPTYYEKIKFVNGIAALPIYSKTEIDRKFVGLDAMSYKGTSGEGGTSVLLNTAALSNGDTYLCAGTFTQTINGVTYNAKKGDMLICRGTEGANGYITASTIVIDVVPSGDNALMDTTYTVVPSTNGFRIVDMSGTSIGGLTVNGDNKFISVSESQDTTNGINTLTVKHKTITSAATDAVTSAGDAKNQQYGASLVVPIVEKIVRDAAGHVTDVKVRNYSLKDTNGHLDTTATYTTSVSNNKVIISSSVKMLTSDGSDAGTATGAFSIESTSLTVKATGAAVTLELEWGTF